MDKTSSTWLSLVEALINQGSQVAPRGKPCNELIHCTTEVPMADPILKVKNRNLGYRFMAAEAYWILSGDNRAKTIEPYSKVAASFSDDGIYLSGAYGPKVISQMAYVAKCLVDDPDSRQAVMTIWRENPAPSKDIPCTVSLQWFIRESQVDGQPELICIDHMRSSDAWLGWPYDVFNFSCVSWFLALILRHHYKVPVNIGNLYLCAGSQHLYDTNLKQARAIFDDEIPETISTPALIDVCENFNSPWDLVEWLDQARQNTLGLLGMK